MYDRPCLGGSSCVEALVSAQDVAVGEWVHIAATYDGSSFMKLYINGMLDTVRTGSFEGLSIETCSIQIGDDPDQGSGVLPVDGILDEIQVHSRVLSDLEIANYYHQFSDAVSIAVTPPLCDNDAATLTAPAGASYLWSTGETTASISYSAGIDSTFSVQVTGASGCTYNTEVLY